MIDVSNTTIKQVSVHYVGNKTNGENIILSKTPIDVEDEKLKEILSSFFLGSFKTEEFYSFTFSNGDFNLNPVYTFASAIFDHPDSFHINSIHLAKHLYENSLHPQIKDGDLFICYFPTLRYGEEQAEALGIFKSENRQDFLKLNPDQNGFSLQYDDGIDINKLDKGCLILNLHRDEGYRLSIIDKANKSSEAQFWKDTFLQIKPYKDEYHYTKEFLSIAKDYVATKMTEEYHVSKADQIDLLNRSVNFFKENESFDKELFENEIFKEESLIQSFRSFDESYRQDNDLELLDSFDISKEAVKKQARNFKGVLKLDKNFHVYIHGDRELIEQGTDADGRKFYKIYYEKEL